MVGGSFSGADVAQVRNLATRMKGQASKMREIVASSSTALLMAEWTGNDIDAIRDRWLRTSKPTLTALADRLHELGVGLDLQADQQENASSASGGGLPGPASGELSWPGWVEALPSWSGMVPGFLENLVEGGEWISGRVDWANEAVRHLAGRDFDAWDVVPGGSYASSVLKGIGLGDAAARLGHAIDAGDVSGGMLAVADGASSLVPTPISLLYTGLKDQISFYIPLDRGSENEHMAWMQERGHSPAAIAERYTGIQGFINLGNDNVERKAPWVNRAADAVFGGVGEWLYNAGIKLY